MAKRIQKEVKTNTFKSMISSGLNYQKYTIKTQNVEAKLGWMAQINGKRNRKMKNTIHICLC